MSGSRFIYPTPLLHGSDFLRSFSDEEKFTVLDALSNSIEPFEISFMRIGYFNRSIPDSLIANDRNAILGLALLSVGISLWDKPDEDFVLVSEIDKEALKQKLSTVFNDVGTQFISNTDNVSYNIKKSGGHFYAPKLDLGCQIADVYGYCCLQKTNGASAFHMEMAKHYDRFSQRYTVNQIVWLNNMDRNFNLEQTNPASLTPGQHLTTPIYGAVKIVPHAKVLVTEPIPSVD